MNVLLYVMTLMLVLAALSYSRLENFFQFFGIQAGFKHYMQTTEKEPINKIARHWYHTIHLSTHDSSSRGSTNPASPRLPIITLLNKDLRQQFPNQHAQLREILKKLMQQYQHNKIFKELESKDSHFLDALLNEIESSADRYFEEHDEKPTKASILSNLEFQNEELRLGLYMMIKGSAKEMDPRQKLSKYPSAKPTQQVTVTSDEEDAAAIECEEAHGDAGYESILDLLTTEKTLKIRMFLASPKLLMAIYEDKDLVDDIVRERRQLYAQVKNHPEKVDEASATFESQFSQAGKAAQYGGLLDFKVSRTNPSRKLS
jgi:hypothetical protein